MHRVTIPEAADILGVTRDAVRKRMKRDSIRYEVGDDGETYVYVDASTTGKDKSANVGDTSGQDTTQAFVESLRDQVEYLRREVAVWQDEARRKDHLLAAALERIPAIEAPPDTPPPERPPGPRKSPVTASEDRGNGDVPPEPEKRPWWRRLFSA